jgi:hypothetical protein
MDEFTASGRAKLSLVPKDDVLPEFIGDPEEEQPLTCDLCKREIAVGTPDDGSVTVSPGGGVWNVCEACRTGIVSQFPPPHSFGPTDVEERADTPDA